MNRLILAGATVLLLAGCSGTAAAASGGGVDWQDCARRWQQVAKDSAGVIDAQQEAFRHMKDANAALFAGDISSATDDTNAATDSLTTVADRAAATTAEVPGTECKQ